MKQKPEVTRVGVLDMQVCVPEDWSDAQVLEFAEAANPCGTDAGWVIRRQGSEYLQGDDERVSCLERSGFVHLMLDA